MYKFVLRHLKRWHGRSPRLEKLKGGGTNDNFLVRVGGEQYVARFQGESQRRFLKLDQRRELYNTRLAHRLGIGPEVVAHYPQFGLLLVRYVKGKVLSPAELRKPVMLVRVVDMLSRLHRGPKFKGRFSVENSINHFWSIVRQDKKHLPHPHPRDLARFRACLGILKQRRAQFVPCHVDLVSINIVRRGKKLTFIDWDYSAMADPLFELAFMSGWSRFKPVHDRFMLSRYFGQVDGVLWRQFMAMKALVHLREAVWALVQLGRSTLPFNYRAYAVKNARWFRGLAIN